MGEIMENKLYGTVLLKAKQILDYIAEAAEAPTLNDLSKNIAISKPTIYKILKTLEYCGYVRVEGDDKRYRLGTVFLHYAESVDRSINIIEIARPALRKLRDATGETINLGMVQDNSIILLSKLESTHSIKLVSIVGGKMNMYSSSMGKALLAEYPSRKLEKYLATVKPQKLTENTITDRDALIQDLAATRQRGYSIDNVENQPGVYCLGFPLVSQGHIYGAFSISTPQYRITEEKKKKFVQLGKQTQQEILAQL